MPRPTESRRADRLECLILAVLCLVAAGILLPTAARAGDVYWARTSGSCRGISFAIGMTCGGVGDYLFSPDPLGAPPSGCTFEASGVEDPRRVDKSGTSSEDEPGTRCMDGACSRGGAGTGNSDKLHMIDWSLGSHGGWTSLVFSQGINYQGWWVHMIDVSLVGLALNVPQASDLHVLESLCDTVRFDPSPRVLNMGFGRLLEEDPCTTDSLACEVSRALEYLHDEQGVILLASAGNHDELLFPASHEDVLAVGMLDNNRYWPTGTVAGTSHTPPAAQALIPGYGLLIFGPTGDGIPPTPPFPAPPGSSNSTALLSGWIAQVDSAHPDLFDFLRDDQPDELISVYTGPDGYYLQVGTEVLEESRLDRIDQVLDGAFGLYPFGFEFSTYEATHKVDVATEPSQVELPSSRPRLLTNTNQPTPDSEPCVPCRLRSRRAFRSPVRDGDLVAVDIEVKASVMAAGGRVDDLLLEVGGELYALSGATYLTLLSDIEDGIDIILQIDIPSALLERQGSPSLVIVMTRLSDNQQLWDAIPISIHLEPIERLFSTTFETADFFPWD